MFNVEWSLRAYVQRLYCLCLMSFGYIVVWSVVSEMELYGCLIVQYLPTVVGWSG